jgi:hypothetical protein
MGGGLATRALMCAVESSRSKDRPRNQTAGDRLDGGIHLQGRQGCESISFEQTMDQSARPSRCGVAQHSSLVSEELPHLVRDVAGGGHEPRPLMNP